MVCLPAERAARECFRLSRILTVSSLLCAAAPVAFLATGVTLITPSPAHAAACDGFNVSAATPPRPPGGAAQSFFDINFGDVTLQPGDVLLFNVQSANQGGGNIIISQISIGAQAFLGVSINLIDGVVESFQIVNNGSAPVQGDLVIDIQNDVVGANVVVSVICDPADDGADDDGNDDDVGAGINGVDAANQVAGTFSTTNPETLDGNVFDVFGVNLSEAIFDRLIEAARSRNPQNQNPDGAGDPENGGPPQGADADGQVGGNGGRARGQQPADPDFARFDGDELSDEEAEAVRLACLDLQRELDALAAEAARNLSELLLLSARLERESTSETDDGARFIDDTVNVFRDRQRDEGQTFEQFVAELIEQQRARPDDGEPRQDLAAAAEAAENDPNFERTLASERAIALSRARSDRERAENTIADAQQSLAEAREAVPELERDIVEGTAQIANTEQRIEALQTATGGVEVDEKALLDREKEIEVESDFDILPGLARRLAVEELSPDQQTLLELNEELRDAKRRRENDQENLEEAKRALEEVPRQIEDVEELLESADQVIADPDHGVTEDEIKVRELAERIVGFGQRNTPLSEARRSFLDRVKELDEKQKVLQQQINDKIRELEECQRSVRSSFLQHSGHGSPRLALKTGKRTTVPSYTSGAPAYRNKADRVIKERFFPKNRASAGQHTVEALAYGPRRITSRNGIMARSDRAVSARFDLRQWRIAQKQRHDQTVNPGLANPVGPQDGRPFIALPGFLGDERFNLFGASTISFGENDDAGQDSFSYAFSGGFSWLLHPRLNVGLAGRYQTADIDSAVSDIDADTWGIAAFAQSRVALGTRAINLEGIVAYSRSNLDSIFNNVGVITTADSITEAFSSQVKASSAFRIDKISISPFVSLSYIATDQDSFLLSDGQFAPGLTNDQVTFSTGASFSASFALPETGITVSPSLGLGAFGTLTDDGDIGLSANGGLGFQSIHGINGGFGVGFSGLTGGTRNVSLSSNVTIPLN